MKPRIIRYKPPVQRQTLLERLNHPALGLGVLSAFLLLASYSLHQHPPRRLNCEDLGRCNLKTGEVYGVTKPRKPTMTTEQIKTAMDVMNLTDAYISKPVVLWDDK